jgi:branched-chain amino acid transport system ATP-binding protein
MLDIKELHVAYGSIKALKGISFSVDAGEIVTLIGANGAGKSTTLKTLSGLLRAQSGSITFEGKEISTAPSYEIVTMGISQVPEGRRIFPRQSVLENLELGAYQRKDRKLIKEDMQRVFSYFPRLAERKSQMAGTLSGGEQQMLAIGRGLMSRPKLMLFDEPSMGLAPLLVQEIFAIIKEINANGTTILLVEQNANMALSIAQKAYVLETGKIVLSGPAEELSRNEQVRKAYLGG